MEIIAQSHKFEKVSQDYISEQVLESLILDYSKMQFIYQKLPKRMLASLSLSLRTSSIPEPELKPGLLTLKSGKSFAGQSFGYPKPITSGEVVFTTSLVGYTESMTDPSYHGQILVFTQPLIGNYGVPPATVDENGLCSYFESEKIQVKGIIVNDYAAKYSHWNAIKSLGQWCNEFKVPALSGIDTRAVVTLLREHGSMVGHISVGDSALKTVPEYESNSSTWISSVSSKTVKVYNPSGLLKIALVDCGAKQNIIRCLINRNCQVTVFPFDFDFSSILEDFDGVFYSNGPGDPIYAQKTVDNCKKIMSKSSSLLAPIPIFGICMGHQVMGLAAGFNTYKLPFGNRGHNQPALNLIKGGCVITSQNHGYAIDDSNCPPGWVPYFRNANDGSNEGIKHLNLPFASVQFHPEAMGGPLDTEFLFDDFVADVENMLRARKGNRYPLPRMVSTEVQPIL